MSKNILLVIIVILGLFLRLNNYSFIPRHGATFDEFAWTWLGINLIQKGVPASWSSHPQYTTREHLIYQGAAFWIVRPYLEHPPLFGLAAGSFALINGARDMYDVSIINIRKLSIIIGTFSIIMLFIYSSMQYGKIVGLISALLYATIPTVVVGSRILQNENFFIPFWLLSLTIFYIYLKKNKRILLYASAVIAGLLSLAKVPWLVAGLSICFILFFHRRFKDMFIVGGIVLAIFSLFIFYGLYFDKELFINLWKLQTARYDITFSGVFSIFLNPLLVDRFYLDGWIVFGWISVLSLAREWKKHVFILLPFICYMFLYVFAIPDEPGHGWYRYPFYPFLVISIAIFIFQELRKQSMARLFFILFVGLGLLNSVWLSKFGFSLIIYRMFLLLAFISVFLPLWFKKSRRLSQVILLLWIGIFIIGNINAVLIFSDL